MCSLIFLIKHILNQYQINAVVHFAAQSHVQNSFDNSQQFTEDNIMGTHNLLECCHKYGKLDRFERIIKYLPLQSKSISSKNLGCHTRRRHSSNW